jgi:shikimate kinase/shikimate kinase/3-dehydroquinate synthase
MKSKGNIVFLGMMASGKTSVGKLISKKLKKEFFDTDQYIENSLGMNISKIFETKGEDYFRKFEQKISLEILKKKDIVISLGGGSFLNKKIRNEILDNHLSFWLNWNNQILIKRIRNSTKRPLAINTSDKELMNLIKIRSNIYSKALYKIDCNELSKLEVVNKIINIYETN